MKIELDTQRKVITVESDDLQYLSGNVQMLENILPNKVWRFFKFETKGEIKWPLSTAPSFVKYEAWKDVKSLHPWMITEYGESNFYIGDAQDFCDYTLKPGLFKIIAMA